MGWTQAVAQVAAGTAPSAASERALVDHYCATWHNDKTKTANFSLQELDLTTVGDHPEIWEQVVRKLCAVWHRRACVGRLCPNTKDSGIGWRPKWIVRRRGM
jgi:hypothetical protein